MQTVESKQEKSQLRISQVVLLWCGIFSSAFYMLMNIIVAALYDGYDIMSQAVSELSAIEAPTRALWVLLALFYSLLTIAFGTGLIVISVKGLLRTVGVLFIINGLIGFFWPPMHQREVLGAGGATLTDTLHIIFTIVTVLIMILSIVFAAKVLKKRFAVYSLITLLIMIFFGILTGMDGRKLDAGLPTPYMGLWERINIGVYMIWVAVLAIVLMRKKNQYE